MTILMALIKELLMVIILLTVANIVLQVFLRKTLIGKLLLAVFRNLWITTKLILRVSKRTGKLSYRYSRKIYKFLNSEYKKLDEKKQTKKTQQKVSNGDFQNVIDLQKFMTDKQHKKISR